MSLFDELVTEALKNRGELAPLRAVVEKELLHHDILREMSEAGLLSPLTFIGGTCLRMVYGSNRLSEDLDFAGGENFDGRALADLGDVLVERIAAKYNLKVSVKEPVQETGNVSTWKLRMITHQAKKNLPQQRIHIDICSLPSYERKPVLLRNHYGVDLGTSGLSDQLCSKSEIRSSFMEEMRRFLPAKVVSSTVEKEEFWVYLTELICAECKRVIEILSKAHDPSEFNM